VRGKPGSEPEAACGAAFAAVRFGEQFVDLDGSHHDKYLNAFLESCQLLCRRVQ
jgi:hypothetical protein